MIALGVATLLLTHRSGNAIDANQQLLSYFLKHVRDERAQAGVSSYGVTRAQFEDCVLRIRIRMLSVEFDHQSDLSIESRAKSIEKAVDEEIKKSLEPTPVLRERLIYQGLYEWVRFRFRYSSALAKPDAPKDKVAFHWVPKNVMAMREPHGVCVVYALTLVEMARHLGLECRPVNGFARRAFDSSKLPMDSGPATWHKWVVLRQRDGMLVPADPTNASIGLEYARKLKPLELDARCTLPLIPEDWAVYNAVYYSSIAPESHKSLGAEWQISSLEYATWKEVDIQPLKRQYSTFTGSTHWKTCLAD